MKLNSFYEKKLPVSRHISSPIFVANEIKEQDLTQQITALETKLKQYEDSIIEHDTIRRVSSAVQDENQNVIFRLEQTEEELRLREADLEEFENLAEANKTYKERINELTSANKSLNNTLLDAQENSKQLNYEMGLLHNTHKEYQETIEEWNTRVLDAEGMTEGLKADNQQLEEAKRDAEYEQATVITKFDEMKKRIDDLSHEMNFWKVSSQSYESQMNELGRVEDQLRSWTSGLEDKLSDGQSNSKKDKSKITYLNKIIKEMSLTIEDLTEHNNYLIDFTSALKVELRKPRYASVGAVQGERFPLAKENIRTKQLGTGKPTLLKFRPKGDENDDN